MYESERIESVELRACAACADERRQRRNRAAGYVCCPDGVRIVANCAEHAAACIGEYAEKLGERWSLETPAGRLVWSSATRELVLQGGGNS